MIALSITLGGDHLYGQKIIFITTTVIQPLHGCEIVLLKRILCKRYTELPISLTCRKRSRPRLERTTRHTNRTYYAKETQLVGECLRLSQFKVSSFYIISRIILYLTCLKRYILIFRDNYVRQYCTIDRYYTCYVCGILNRLFLSWE